MSGYMLALHGLEPWVAAAATTAGLPTPILFGIASGGALVLGALVALIWTPSETAMGLLLAFAGGSLVTAAAYELIEPAFGLGGPVLASGALLVGAAIFGGFDFAFTALTEGGGESGWSLLASVTLDGVPENAALGIVLLEGSGAGVALVAAFFASNFPQALGGTQSMLGDDYGLARTFGGWLLVAILVGGSVWAGTVLFAGFGQGALAALRAFAGGTILASLADEIFPDAYGDVSSATAIATALGFLMTHLLH